MITKRTLENWRKESLGRIKVIKEEKVPDNLFSTAKLDKRILSLTQELLDQILLEKGRK
ncbi:MAG: hypothetical protein WCY49_07075 [Anaerovoracaceae bacterium]